MVTSENLKYSLIACEQALGRMEGKRKSRACMHVSDFTIPPLFDISVIYAKYLVHN